MVLTTGMRGPMATAASSVPAGPAAGGLPGQPPGHLVPAAPPRDALPGPGGVTTSSSSSSCGSYSDHEDDTEEPAAVPARLTLRDEAVAQRPQQQGPKAQPAESSQSEWELSGEDGEDGEGGDSGEEATPTAAAAPKTVSRSSWLAALFGLILRPFKWKSSSGLHRRCAEAASEPPRRASLSSLAKAPEATSPEPGEHRIPFKKSGPPLRHHGKKKRRRRRRPLSLCTANCRYDVVRRVAKRFGMKDVSEDEPWNLYWTDLSISLERCKDMKRFQKINHFPGMAEICRKDLLARNLNRMLRLFPKDYNFFPKTWCLPADLGDLNAYARSRRNRTYILKPDTGCQGKGIYLTRSVRDLKPHTRMICQVYIARPFLVDGFKFDMRVYTLVTSCDPLRVFVYNDGLVRFATSLYHEPNSHNTANVFMHLTNYAVNKHSRTFIVDEEAGSKRKISTLNRWLESKNYDVADIWSRIDELIVKTLIAALPVIRHNYHACFPAHDFTYACFELLGFDVLLDHKLKPYVLEVNHSPSFHTDAQIDREVKETLLMDTFGILNLGQYDKRKVMEEDRRRVRDRLLQSIGHREGNAPGYEKSLSRKDLISWVMAKLTGSEPNNNNAAPAEHNPWKAQFDWEDNNMGNFRRVYPLPPGQPDKYEAFFNQNQSSLFQETAASRAREEASRQQRDLHEQASQAMRADMARADQRQAVERANAEAKRVCWHIDQVKQKEEEARRSMTLARRKEYERLRPESPGAALGQPGHPAGSQLRRGRNARGKRTAAMPMGAGKRAATKCVLNSFLPEAIVDAEEAVRAAALQERSQLVQSKGIVQLIYQMMKENKTLCAEDLRKYAAMNAEAGQRRDDDHRLPALLTLIQKTTGQQGHTEASRSKGALEPYEALVTGLSGPCPIATGAGGEPAASIASVVSAPAMAPCLAPAPAAPAAPARGPLPLQCPRATVSGLGVTCAEAPFWVRPGLAGLNGLSAGLGPVPALPGLRPDLWSSNCAHLAGQAGQATQQLYAAPRITRSTLGRLVSTSFKLHNLEKRQAKPQAQQL